MARLLERQIAEHAEDQASGLRRIFSLANRNVGPMEISFVGSLGGTGGGKTGRNMIVAELARAFAQLGKEVLIVDENHGPDSIASAFGIAARFDLIQAVNCDVPPHQVVIQAEPSIRVVPAARAAREFSRLDGGQRRAVSEWLRRLQKGVDVVLVDSATYPNESSLLQTATSRMVVVTASNAEAIKGAYGHIKRLAKQEPSRRFDVVVARADSRQIGEGVFNNINDVAQLHLGIELHLLGCVATKIPLHGFVPNPRENFVGECKMLAEALLHPIVPASKHDENNGRAGVSDNTFREKMFSLGVG